MWPDRRTDGTVALLDRLSWETELKTAQKKVSKTWHWHLWLKSTEESEQDVALTLVVEEYLCAGNTGGAEPQRVTHGWRCHSQVSKVYTNNSTASSGTNARCQIEVRLLSLVGRVVEWNDRPRSVQVSQRDIHQWRDMQRVGTAQHVTSLQCSVDCRRRIVARRRWCRRRNDKRQSHQEQHGEHGVQQLLQYTKRIYLLIYL